MRIVLALGVAGGALGAAQGAAALDLLDTGAIRLIVGGEASASIAEKDRGFFNDYEYGGSPLRLVRARLNTEMKIGPLLAVLGEVRHENADHPHVYSLYLRVHPWPSVPFDLQAGQIPPLFGAYPRRAYAADNPLIGEPLAYQYLTSLRADAAPGTVGDLLAMRGRGWRVQYAIGSPDAGAGLTTVNTQRWDTGLQARLVAGTVEVAAAVTQGSPSNPRVEDDNDGKCVSARVAWWPVPGLIGGLSAARGRYLDRELEHALGPQSQRALGADLEYSRGRWMLRAEGLRSSWDSPVPGVSENLDAWSAMVEARMKVMAGVTVAARADTLVFGHIAAEAGPARWDHPVTRFEAGVTGTPRRNLILKAAFQHNRRDGVARQSSFHQQSFLAGQVLLWF